MKRILVTGGAGFVGSNLAFSMKEDYPAADVVVLDNLRRRGSEINLERFRRAGIIFRHGDIRQRSDLSDLEGNFDLMIEASAEPSVNAGMDGSPDYVVETNLLGTLNCLEFVRKRVHSLVFLSTSRVYSIRPLRELHLREAEQRLEIEEVQDHSGVTPRGIAEGFPTDSARSIYGATKLASELMIQEYVAAFGTRAVINRCGVIAGPGQFGKVDQGVFTWWVASHYFGRSLRYTGFGGTGKQVRDLLHPADLYALIEKQISTPAALNGEVYNVGGGRTGSTSLLELTGLCREAVGREVPVEGDPVTNKVDIPVYLSDTAKAEAAFDWKPSITPFEIVRQIAEWIRADEAELRPVLGI